jgi:molybdate transport system substrate-binding protein
MSFLMPRAGVPARRRSIGLALALGLALTGCAGGSGPGATGSSPGTDATTTTLTVFAAASLTEAFHTLADDFEAAHPGVDVALSYGGSAALAQQIVEGAPVDVFASAAEPQMRVVVDAGLASDPVVFATNSLELIVPAGNPAGVTGVDDLGDADLRIALCDPTVPCGAASEQLLAEAGVSAAPDTLESDVKAVLTKVVLGEVDAALVYRTDALAAGDEVDGIEVPGAASVANRYPIATVGEATASGAARSGAAGSAAAEDFVSFVTGQAGRAVLADAGFGAP